LVERLYTIVVTASRAPALYTGLGLADTFEGRFESLTLHAALVLRALNAAPPPGSDLAQDLVDTVFQHFDRTLREMGVGDTTVPKRMKTMAEAFLGRSAAYDDALRHGDAPLNAALTRNTGAGPGQVAALTAYVRAAAAVFERLPVQDFIDGTVRFPDPTLFVPEERI
jgi:cytochrome b pre-mRNA-processing protein 3